MFRKLKKLLLILPLLYLLSLSPSPAQAQGTAPVLAYYYVWWWPEAMGEGKTVDWPEPLHYSTDVMPQQVGQMASAGIDGMVVGWFGPREPTTEARFTTVLDLAAANGITALLSVDLGTATWFASTDEILEGMRHAINVHTQHPAYFRYNGKPVFVFWFQGRYSLDEWAAIRQQVDPNHDTIWIAEGAVPDAMPTFDGLHMYTISWADNVYGTLASWGDTTRGRGGYWMATTMPGWDNTYTQQSEKYVRSREDGNFYRDTFAAAAASGPNMILITSWNEWLEGSYIEPSHLYGDFYLNLTRELISEYKGSGSVAGGGASAPPAPAAPAGSGNDAPTAIPAAPVDTQPDTSIAAIPTFSLPPTITPTPLPTNTPDPLIVAEVIPELTVESETLPPPEIIEEESQASSIEDNSKIILGLGIVGGGIGLMLLAIVGGLAARKKQEV